MEITGDAERVLADRITKALEYAEMAVYDGEHHKTWVVDQIVRALTGCPMVTVHAVDAHGEAYDYEAQGESDAYRAFVAEMEGSWDEGIAP